MQKKKLDQKAQKKKLDEKGQEKKIDGKVQDRLIANFNESLENGNLKQALKDVKLELERRPHNICFEILKARCKFLLGEKIEAFTIVDGLDVAEAQFDAWTVKELVNFFRGNITCNPAVWEPVAVKAHVCSADGKLLNCFKDENDFYFPFSFLKKQYDVTGKMSKDSPIFEWFTSYSKVRLPEGSYDSKGCFGHFATYSVENRDRVRCISAESGVPMSTQWDPQPYYYPIQIAQYGLQHYSRMKASNGTEFISVNVGRDTNDWKGSPGDADTSERVFFRDDTHGPIVNLSTPVSLSSPGCYVYLDENPALHVVSFEWKPNSNASFTILVKLLESNSLVLLNYVDGSDDRCVWNDTATTSGNEQLSFSYSLGLLDGRWQRVSRDALVDASRALSSLNVGKKKDGNVVLHTGEVKLVTLGFRGEVAVKQRIQQATSSHESMFITAADWMVQHQNEKGGWSVPVERSIADRRLVLPAGWHSAMAQGHALSLLSRAFTLTKNVSYIESAAQALRLFEIPSEDGGVRASFMGSVWFEEYPTSPGSFVLNGFMYSLIGLFDYSDIVLADHQGVMNSSVMDSPKHARRLFDEGVKSLKLLLPLYDTGSGSIYDLRHFGLKTAPNLARWDYHAVHVYLLKWLVQITDDVQLNETADRWVGYSYGKRAKHN